MIVDEGDLWLITGSRFAPPSQGSGLALRRDRRFVLDALEQCSRSSRRWLATGHVDQITPGQAALSIDSGPRRPSLYRLRCTADRRNWAVSCHPPRGSTTEGSLNHPITAGPDLGLKTGRRLT
jgi:hypothetical protein